MITKRIIPCLDVKDGRVVKGVNFEGLHDVNSPIELAEYYTKSGADELVFYDITASAEGRGLFTDILRTDRQPGVHPLTVGGGINTLEDFDRVLKCGADKVSVNSGAIRNPDLIRQAALRYGASAWSLRRREAGGGPVPGLRPGRPGRHGDGGHRLDPPLRGPGRRGSGGQLHRHRRGQRGFDLEMLAAVCQAVKVPVIASGGAGKVQDFVDLFQTPAWGGRGAGGLGVPLWGRLPSPRLKQTPAGPQHPRALMIGKEKSHAGQADHGTTEV